MQPNIVSAWASKGLEPGSGEPGRNVYTAPGIHAGLHGAIQPKDPSVRNSDGPPVNVGPSPNTIAAAAYEDCPTLAQKDSKTIACSHKHVTHATAYTSDNNDGYMVGRSGTVTPPTTPKRESDPLPTDSSPPSGARVAPRASTKDESPPRPHMITPPETPSSRARRMQGKTGGAFAEDKAPSETSVPSDGSVFSGGLKYSAAGAKFSTSSDSEDSTPDNSSYNTSSPSWDDVRRGGDESPNRKRTASNMPGSILPVSRKDGGHGIRVHPPFQVVPRTSKYDFQVITEDDWKRACAQDEAVYNDFTTEADAEAWALGQASAESWLQKLFKYLSAHGWMSASTDTNRTDNHPQAPSREERFTHAEPRQAQHATSPGLLSVHDGAGGRW